MDNTARIEELVLKLKQAKSREIVSHQDASDKFLEIKTIEDKLYDLGYHID